MARDAKWYANWVRLLPASSADVKMCNLEAADLMEELDKQVPRWISVEERMPEHMDDVLVWVGGLAEVGCHDENDDCWELYTYVGDGSVTHWMPLPEPPKEPEA